MFKISSFVEHYLEHKESDQSINFIEFIRLHYSNDKHADKHKEHNLPFKHHQDFSHIAQLLKINISKKINSEFLLFQSFKKSFVIKNENKYSSLFKITIWQPPKF
jgi:hypothetical protein